MNRRREPGLNLGVMLALLAGLCHSPAAAAALGDFGFGNMTVNGVAARGTRPLVTILTEFAGSPALAHDVAYYDNLVYNALQKSVNGYYLANSNARFFWARAGVGTIGPFHLSAAEGRLPEMQRLARVKAVAMESGFDFAQFDDNRDGRVTTDELSLLIIDNLSERGAANRSTDPVGVQAGGSTVSLESRVASAAHRASFMSIVHELSHSLGTVDLYGSNSLSQSLTLMGATIFDNDDDRSTFHLDPWHKMQLGWSEPRIRSLQTSGTELLPAANTATVDAPIILQDPVRGTGEFFLLEYRTPANQIGLNYDENVADAGLLIWHVKQDGNKQLVTVPSLVTAGQVDSTLFAEGAPDLVRGGNIAWHSGAVTPPLRWLDGTSTGIRIQVRAFVASDSAISIVWGPAAQPAQQWTGWAPIGSSSSGPPVVGRNADGRLELFVRGTDRALWHVWQSAPNGSFADWHSLGGGLISDPILGTNADGRMEVFARGLDNALWHKWQIAASGPFVADWYSLGGGFHGDPIIGYNTDGRMELFARGLDNGLWHKWQTAPSGPFIGDWSSLGGGLNGEPAVGANADGRMEVFARGLDNALWHKWQTAPSGPFTGNWFSLGGIVQGNASVGRNADGRLMVFARGADNGLFYCLQTAPNGPFAAWQPLYGGLTTDPVVAANRDGCLQVFARGLDNGLFYRLQTTPNGSFGPWVALGGTLAAKPAVGQNADGRLEVFVQAQDGSLWHRWQTAPGSTSW
jgi:M6 family metalloprotease-like protein